MSITTGANPSLQESLARSDYGEPFVKFILYEACNGWVLFANERMFIETTLGEVGRRITALLLECELEKEKG